MTNEHPKDKEENFEFHARNLQRKADEVRNLYALIETLDEKGAKVIVDIEENSDRIYIRITSEELLDHMKTISEMCSSTSTIDYDYNDEVFKMKEEYLLY